jgi:hypothetical protein
VASYRVIFVICYIIYTSPAVRVGSENLFCGHQMRLHTRSTLLAVKVLETQDVLTVTNGTCFPLTLLYTYILRVATANILTSLHYGQSGSGNRLCL